MSYAARLVMHLNHGSNGSTMVKELTDFPGVQVSDFWNKKTRATTRTIVFDNVEYKTLDEAAQAWKDKNGQQKPSDV